MAVISLNTRLPPWLYPAWLLGTLGCVSRHKLLLAAGDGERHNLLAHACMGGCIQCMCEYYPRGLVYSGIGK